MKRLLLCVLFNRHNDYLVASVVHLGGELGVFACYRCERMTSD